MRLWLSRDPLLLRQPDDRAIPGINNDGDPLVLKFKADAVNSI